MLRMRVYLDFHDLCRISYDAEHSYHFDVYSLSYRDGRFPLCMCFYEKNMCLLILCQARKDTGRTPRSRHSTTAPAH